MLPFVAAIVITASLVAWYYNEKTDEEKDRQKKAYTERENMRRRYNKDSNKESHYFTVKQSQQAKSIKELLLNEIELLKEKIDPISSSLNKLFQVIKEEINADTTSPYRKSALQKEYARTEDAKVRLEEYKKYLKFEEKRINNYWENKKYSKLIELEIPDALLPLEWLYSGKLVLVEMSEIGKPLPKFKHRLLFSKNRAQQQALALTYGDYFPVLVEQKGSQNDGAFFCCVAKGISFHDYIRSNTKVDMIITGYLERDKVYKGILFDGLLKVNLPKKNLLDPSIYHVNSEKIAVYFEHFDSTLSCNPGGGEILSNRKKPFVTVSEKPPTFLGQDEIELYIEVKEQQLEEITDKSFYSQESQWTLINHQYDTKEVIFGKANVQLTCVPTEEHLGLKVIKITQFLTPQIGIALPFDFILLSTDLEAHKYLGWSYGIEQFYSFVGQVLINKDDAQVRIKKVEFFKRWQQILNYQKKHESECTVEFKGSLEKLDKNTSLLMVPKSIVNPIDNKGNTIYSRFKEIKENCLKFHKCCKLFVWNSNQADYQSAIDSKWNSKTEYQLNDDNTIKIQASFYNLKESSESQKFKLEIILPNPSLQRQQQGLDALFKDRLVEPRLKEIFLSPSHYKAESIYYWKNKDIDWQDNLTDNQKQVIQTALAAKHIAMLQGPPGTGKTTTIVEMLYQLLTHNPNQKILIVSQQNTAVDNALTKFKKRFPKLLKNSINIVRIGNLKKLDDGILEDHFDQLFQVFLTERLQYITQKIPLPDTNIQNAADKWITLLHEMQNISEKKISDEFFSAMLADKNLIGATCVGLAARKAGVDHIEFDITIVDEAGRATVPELLIPLLRSKKAILIGDHHQLPPSIAPILREDSTKEELSFLKESFLENSFFEILYEQLPAECTASLQDQFRMASPIGDLVAELFYTNNGKRQLLNGHGITTDTSHFMYHDCLCWFDVQGKQYKVKNSTSLQNDEEADAIYRFLKEISNAREKLVNVAVITPYSAQKRNIRKLLGKSDQQEIQLGYLKIKVDTVDSFQGSEAEIVCYSTVRTKGSLQFLLDKKRLNVACSRAKENLIFFGDSAYLKKWKPKKCEQNLFSKILNKTTFIENEFK